MKFAHLADIHLGGWREPKLQELGFEAFRRAITACIEEKVDFALIAGDLFNSALPAIEALKIAVEQLKRLQEQGIPVYLIAGSHDYSPSGKSMIEVLEKTGLFTNVAKGEAEGEHLRLLFTTDKKTGAKITGILGKRGGLEKGYYESLLREPLEKEQGYKIFIFHTLLTEFKTKGLERADSQPLSLLPPGFSYYAGGHVHLPARHDFSTYPHVAYAGPLFPNSFSELEELKHGGFWIVDNGSSRRIEIPLKKVVSVCIPAEGMSAERASSALKEALLQDVSDALITIRIEGMLSSGTAADIRFKDIIDDMYSRGAYFVMKNTAKLSSPEFEEIKVEGNIEEIEDKLIQEHLGQIACTSTDEMKLIKDLMHSLSSERGEGEKVADYEKRIKEEAKKIIL